MSRVAQPKPSGHGWLFQRRQRPHASSVPPLGASSGIRALHARSPHVSLRRLAGDSMLSSFKKPATMLHTSRISPSRTLVVPTSLLLNKGTFEPDAAGFTISGASSAKDTWRMAALVVRGSAASLLSTVTFCAVHVHNTVVKKRDASTSLLRRLHAHMVQHIIMSAFSKLGDVFSDREFAAPGNSLLWALGGLHGTCRECTSSSCPKSPYEWRVDATAATSSTTPTLASDPVTRPLTSLFSFIFVSPACQAPTAAAAALKPNNVAWNVPWAKNDRIR